jgi:hypothetical protein
VETSKVIIKVESKITAVQCVSCGVIFGIEEGFLSLLKRQGRDFFCTNGHKMTYTADNPEANKLAAIVERQEAQIETLKEALDSKASLPMRLRSSEQRPTLNLVVSEQLDPYAD